MIWFFERRDATLIYEIRRQADGDDYELVVTFPEGRQEIEKFRDPHALIERSHRLEESLRRDGWSPPPTSRVAGARFPSVA
jgi:hypothetical protein